MWNEDDLRKAREALARIKGSCPILENWHRGRILNMRRRIYGEGTVLTLAAADDSGVSSVYELIKFSTQYTRREAEVLCNLGTLWRAIITAASVRDRAVRMSLLKQFGGRFYSAELRTAVLAHNAAVRTSTEAAHADGGPRPDKRIGRVHAAGGRRSKPVKIAAPKLSPAQISDTLLELLDYSSASLSGDCGEDHRRVVCSTAILVASARSAGILDTKSHKILMREYSICNHLLTTGVGHAGDVVRAYIQGCRNFIFPGPVTDAKDGAA